MSNRKKIRFEIVRASDGKQWFLRIVSVRNGKTIVVSETYLRIKSPTDAALLIKENAADADIVIIENGQTKNDSNRRGG